ncbi:MAG: mandelate racemase/muconate lactonizing enzyme family protein [Caldilineaceae bacterium]|nr:mandelate racemase/muconate lactonizing enzyme family protein [Caldilineaceae bacterium]MDE0337795.1 mandelate racemase/muconate lactonizing enzyme family protein [Caldilineaceae bacterium]
MKITAIETIALLDPGKATETVVRVHTDEGISGIGQAESPSLVIEAIIRCDGGLEEILQGEDPLQVERLWQKMYAATGLFGRRGVTIAAIGAVETALWDIAGQALDRPVCELIWQACCTVTESSEVKEKVRPYATVYPPGEDVGEIVERFTLARDRNFRAMKLEEWPGGFSHVSIQRDVEVVQAARATIGEDRDLLIDVQNRWYEVGQALESIRAIEEFRPFFVEAPLPADNLPGLARLADAVDTRIAVGDWGFTTRFEFEEIMEKGRVDVVQPSSVRSGGIREITRIAEAAYRRGLICVPHAWCHMVGVAAEIHLAAVLPNMPYFEMPIAIPDSPIISELLEPVIEVDADGLIEVPKRPGLGFALNEEVVEQFRVDPH